MQILRSEKPGQVRITVQKGRDVMPTEEELEQLITEHIDQEDVTDIQPQKRSDE